MDTFQVANSNILTGQSVSTKHTYNQEKYFFYLIINKNISNIFI